MEEEGGGHRYEVLSPTKHSKGKRTDRRTVMLTVAVAATVTSVIVIIATVLVSTLSSSQLDASLLITEANIKIKVLVNASESCNKLNNASTCFFASSMSSEGCDYLTCKSYTWKLKITGKVFSVKYEQGSDHQMKAPNGLPCADNKFCYKQQCVEAEDKFNVKELRDSTNRGGWEVIDSDKTMCITIDMKDWQKKEMDKIKKEGSECSHPSGHSLRMEFYSCTNPVPYGVERPCKDTPVRKGIKNWEYPFMFVKEKDCGRTEVKQLKAEVDKACSSESEKQCTYKCGRDNVHVNTSLLACQSSSIGELYGFCYEDMCVPAKQFHP
ncbi:hypothetical protein M514_06792, partial [Trichuris suis]